ncbi:MAG: hypothetical protein ACK40G_02605 [Cytophagaceae bacterium]
MKKDLKFYLGFMVALFSFLGISFLFVVGAFILRILTFGFFKYNDLKLIYKELAAQEEFVKSFRGA